MKSRYVYSLFLIITGAWWGWTILVDFFVVKAVFSTIDDFWKAGELGMNLFSKLNSLEVIAASVLTALMVLQFKKNRTVLPLLILSLVVWTIAMTYFTFLSPKIIELTGLWQQADLIGQNSSMGIPDLQQEHAFYHKLYISLDSIKLLILTTLMGLGILRQEKMF